MHNAPKPHLPRTIQACRNLESFSGALRTLFWASNGGVGHPPLQGFEYKNVLHEPSAMERVFAIFANVIELDAEGTVTGSWTPRVQSPTPSTSNTAPHNPYGRTLIRFT